MDPTQRFSDRADNYARYRPGYPPGVLALLERECGLTKDSIVVDVGSGSGLLARVFLENGNAVFGVEPNPEMRRAGEQLLAGYEMFTSVVGSAERTTLRDGCADFVTVGQAFHWFDPEPTRAEFVRILRPGGRVVLVWNERRIEESGFAAAYELLLDVYGTDYEQVNRDRRGNTAAVRSFFVPSTVETAVFENAQTLDLAGLKGRLLSSSYVPAEGTIEADEMLGELKSVFYRYEQDGHITLRYDTCIYYGELLSA